MSLLLNNLKSSDPREVDPNLGTQITQIIPCLDPDTPESQKIDFPIMSQRTMQDDLIQVFDSEDCTANYLAENNPNFINYMPSEEVGEKLIRRMIGLKDPAKELWNGFEVVTEQLTGGFKHAVWTVEPEAVELEVSEPEVKQEEN